MKGFRSMCLFICIIIGLPGCNHPDESAANSYELGVIAAFSEMVEAGVKPLALSTPMETALMDDIFPEFEKIASQHGVQVYREEEFIATDLFPAGIASGKEVCILFKGNGLVRYQQLKQDIADLVAQQAYTGKAREAIARRFGRLLGYSPEGINRLLAKQTDFRTLRDFGVEQERVILFYQDLKAAVHFYGNLLGLEEVAQDSHSHTFRVGATSLLTLMDNSHALSEKPKAVAIALLTDQLEAWWAYVQEKQIAVKYPLKVKPDGPHDGFVAVDPEGYLLEFERFHQHPENEKFIPVLDGSPTVLAKPNSAVPGAIGFKGMITWLYYRDLLAMEDFYEAVLGFEKVADQGWTKIFQVSPTGFIGLVDERRGMLRFSEEKAVILSFSLEKRRDYLDYLSKYQPFILLQQDSSAVTGKDPESYLMQF